MFLRDTIKSLNAYKVAYALVGGYAVALHGAVRGTVDVDIVIRQEKKAYRKVEQALQSMGLHARLPVTADEVFTFRDEYIRNKNLIAWSFVNLHKPSEIIDIIITENLANLTTVTKQAFGMRIKLVSIADLIAMKRRASRPQDLLDIAALEKLK